MYVCTCDVALKKNVALKDCLWSCIHAVTQGPRRRVNLVVSVYGSASGFSERTQEGSVKEVRGPGP